LRNIAAMLKGIVLLIPSCERYTAGASVEETKAQSFSQPSPFAIAKCQRQVTAAKKNLPLRQISETNCLRIRTHSTNFRHQARPPSSSDRVLHPLFFSTVRALSYPSRATPTRFPV
jgi:hypothetical protein